MSIISLLTDFGTDDEYVGTMKGVILSINPSAKIIDITHNLEPQDIVQAAYLIQSCHAYFPKGTVHIVVVDPGVGSSRSIIALKTATYFFIAPDNGVLTLVMESDNIDSIVCVNNSNFFLEPVSHTFHGRDIFAPVGAHLSKGVEITKLGTPVDKEDVIHLNIPEPSMANAAELIGTIVSIDRFGNLITNIDEHRLEKFFNGNPGAGTVVKIGKSHIRGLSKSYASAGLKEPLAIISSRGCLEIALNHGNARNHFRAQKGDPVSVILKKG